MLKSEWQWLKKHKFYMLVIFVLFFVPSIYAVTFLGSLWNPYGEVSKLPVAVVNKDQAVTYQGKKLKVGHDLKNELEKSDAMNFKFPSEKAAEKGLDSGKYYTVITIPKNFSAHATTLLDKTPKQMKLQYETSSGHSFIAGKLSETGAQKIGNQISDKVTKIYTKTIFKEMKQAGDGMTKAGKANKKLADGANTLKSGSDQVTTNLEKLASSSLTFEDGAKTLTQGVGQYTSAVGTASDGSSQLANGLNQMNQQAPTLISGIDQLSQGTQQYTAAVGTAADGSQTLSTGLNQLDQQIPTFANGVNKLNDGLSQLNQEMVDNDVKGNLAKVQKQVSAISSVVDDTKSALPDDQTINSQFDTLQSDLKDLAKANAADQDTLTNNVNAAMQEADIDISDEQKAKFVKSLVSKQSDTQTAQVLATMTEHAKSLQSNVTQLEEVAQKHQATLTELAQSAKNTDLHQVNNQLTKMAELPDAVDQLASGSQQLNDKVPDVQKAVGQLSGGAQTLSDGLQTLQGKSATLNDGVATLQSGAQQLSGGVGQLANGAQTLDNGLQTLSGMSGQLNSGASQLSSGAGQISDGSGQLADAAKQMGPALTEMNKGNTTLADQLGKAGKQADQLKGTKDTFKQMASPATVSHTEKDQVPNNGTGMVPYMFSVGMFVGMMALNLMLDMVSPRGKVSSLGAWFGSKMLILFGIATMAAVTLYALSDWILGMDPVNPGQTMLIMLLTSYVDAALVTAIYMWFGKAGAFVSMVLLVLQLSVAAGTYPIELSNKFYEWLHPLVPMTYSVNGLRETIMIGGSISTEVIVLVSVGIVSLLAMFIYFVVHLHNFRILNDMQSE
ncbi:YhgE/Pip domain-containing protein [Weissella thailandensis]|uniref:YhgE/Pip domain-containing protein n=1 Tax=Weissella thailandensis TaxID=89061 RepID=A0ABX9I3U0_9LACO|nr:YhgE/Pip domain-containing protein [Weissella thailandensis]NKY91122.1 YhgE/Pip domain-containing protein [Weissella thailandensis]RDS59375.1 YhgE/Pip domain-containing protein [Weissella thailandensis]GEP74481.1 membrane protein [Weissella thailandensis]